ncbi:cytochrome P450 120 isoform X1 [Solea senegalensis]|uniref:Cytochrome P450 120 isoform X1 n=1 Tax=Solea senegalensis TaxID=28829 RepID=A0AAV6R1F5_SOLSE|nr:cytochrome P450 120 isoform X1 [Solea senegalensis]
MSKLPGNAGLSLLGDKSLDFYRDPVSFYRQKMDKHGGRVFQSRLLNRPTAFICSVEGMRELLSGEEACLLRLSLTSLFTGRCLESQRDFISSVCERCLKDLSLSGQPECVYSVFKRLGTELVLGLFLNVRAEEQPELFQEIMQLCTQHWHGLISAPVNVKVPLWSSGFSTALEARDKLMDIIKDKLENDKEGFVGSLGSLPLPDSSAASQHLLLFISALIPKAVASLLTSFTLVLGGNEQEETRRRAGEDPDYLHRVLLEVQRLWPPFIGGRRIADQDSTLAGFHVPKGNGVIYISHGVHRDPEVFEEPDNFQPERWRGRNAGQEHLLCSFGSGPRSCIGSKLADIFLKDVCMYLLKHYDWCLDPPSQDLEYKWLPVSRPADPPTVSFTRLDQTRSDESDTS